MLLRRIRTIEVCESTGDDSKSWHVPVGNVVRFDASETVPGLTLIEYLRGTQVVTGYCLSDDLKCAFFRCQDVDPNDRA